MLKKEYLQDIGELEISDYTPTQEEIVKIEKFEKQAEKDIASWGGKRKGAGRKPITDGSALCFQVRLSAKEKEFIQYARLHKLNLGNLMQ